MGPAASDSAMHIGVTLLSLLASAGGGAVVAIAIFKVLGQKWIDGRFAKDLEKYKHEQVLQVQRLRIEIDSLLSGSLKLQEKEFESLPVIWEKLDITYRWVRGFVSPVQKFHDVASLSDEALEEFLSGSQLPRWKQVEIINAKDRGHSYQDAVFWQDLHACKMKAQDLRETYERFAIFLPPGLKDLLDGLTEAFFTVLTEKELNHPPRGAQTRDVSAIMREQITPARESVRKLIQERLRAHGEAAK